MFEQTTFPFHQIAMHNEDNPTTASQSHASMAAHHNKEVTSGRQRLHPEQVGHGSKSTRDGRVARLVEGASSSVFHVIRSVHMVAASYVRAWALRHSHLMPSGRYTGWPRHASHPGYYVTRQPAFVKAPFSVSSIVYHLARSDTPGRYFTAFTSSSDTRSAKCFQRQS